MIVLLLLFCLVESKPILVIEFLRHGARSPISKQPFFNYTRWKIPGELTAVGERQHYLLGHLRRKHYIEDISFLPKVYDPSLIYVMSSAITRTMMTLESYMQGLYPEGLGRLNENQVGKSKNFLKPRIELTINESIINDLHSSAVPFDIPTIHFSHLKEAKDHLLLFTECALATETANKFEQQFDAFFNRYNDLWANVLLNYKNFTRAQLKSHAVSFCDFILCADTDGVKPVFITQQILNKCKDFIGEYLRDIVAIDHNCIKASSKPIASTVLNWMHNVRNKQTKVKYVVYSAHDTTVTRVLLALKEIKQSIVIKTTPPFAANVLFELSDDGKVNVYYNGDHIYEEDYQKFKEDFERTAELHISYKEACKVQKGIELSESLYWDPYSH